MSDSAKVSNAIKGRIEEAQRLRGWLLNSYAQIEFLLGAIIADSIKMGIYSNLGQSVPHKATERIKIVRKIIETDGPYSNQRDFIEIILNDFEGCSETRNLLAHGFCQYVFIDNDDWGMKFTKWHREKSRPGGNLRFSKVYRISDLRVESRKMSDIAQMMIVEFSELEAKYSSIHSQGE